MSYFVHEKAICESTSVGDRTRIWAFTHILSKVTIGEDCNICESVFIEDNVTIGNRVTIKNGVQIWNGTLISDDVFIGPNVTLTNDKYPRSRQWQIQVPIVKIEKGASVGANSTILPGLTLGANSLVGAGSVVTKSVPPFAIVCGNPARITGYINSNMDSGLDGQSTVRRDSRIKKNFSLTGGCELRSLELFSDLRGNLLPIDFNQFQFFRVERAFFVYGVPGDQIRGKHAHRTCSQFMIVLKGSVKILISDGLAQEELTLSSDTQGLFVPPMVWSEQSEFSDGAILIVLASESYNSDEYIHSFTDFKNYKLNHGSTSIG